MMWQMTKIWLRAAKTSVGDWKHIASQSRSVCWHRQLTDDNRMAKWKAHSAHVISELCCGIRLARNAGIPELCRSQEARWLAGSTS